MNPYGNSTSNLVSVLLAVAMATVISAATSFQSAETANNVIKNETVANQNTATRIGNAFNGVLEAAVLEVSSQSSDFTAAAGYLYSVDTSGGAVTVTAPAAPVTNDIFEITDEAGTFGTSNCTVSFGSYPLHSLTSPSNSFVGDANYTHRRFRFDGTRWLITQ